MLISKLFAANAAGLACVLFSDKKHGRKTGPWWMYLIALCIATGLDLAVLHFWP